MPVKPEAFEYYGQLMPRDPASSRILDIDLSAPVRSAECGMGHSWPPANPAGPCTRCGKPSSIPTTETCEHGVPHRGRFGGHDCDYAHARDELTRYAALAASADVPGADTAGDQSPNSERWDRAFHRHMARLVTLARRVA